MIEKELILAINVGPQTLRVFGLNVEASLQSVLLVEMYPSFDSARFDSFLTRVFKKKARLGSLTYPKNSVYRKRPKRVDFRF